MTKKPSFIRNRVLSIKYAFNGAWRLVSKEASIQVQLCIAIVMTIAGFLCNLSSTEWIIQVLTIGLIFVVEGINTAIEEIADFIHPEYHVKIGLIKDISAGAVFLMAIVAIIIGGIIYFPKIF